MYKKHLFALYYQIIHIPTISWFSHSFIFKYSYVHFLDKLFAFYTIMILILIGYIYITMKNIYDTYSYKKMNNIQISID